MDVTRNGFARQDKLHTLNGVCGNEPEGPPPKEFTRVRLREFMAAEHALDYLIDGILVDKQPGVLAGSKKTLKTSIMLDLALSLTSVTPFLGRFAVRHAARVGVMTGESGEATVQETLWRIARAKGVDPLRYEFPLLSFELPNLADPTDLDALKRFIDDEELTLLCIDPSYLCMPLGQEAGNLFVVGALLSGLSAITRRTGCGILIVHHNRKGSDKGLEPPELEDIAWAGFPEWARQWLLLGRRERFNPESPGEHDLWFNVGGSAGHHGLWAVDVTEGRRSDPGGRVWDVRVDSATRAIAASQAAREGQREEDQERKRQARLTKDAARLLEVLDTCPNGDTRRGLSERAGLSRKACEAALQDLEERGLVERCEVVKNKRREEGIRRANRWDTVGQSRRD